jgi:hypothetical protein
MTFQYVDQPYLDSPPQLADLRFVSGGNFGALPLLPFALAGGGALVGATVTAWLGEPSWSVGEYNHWMKQMNDSIAEWDKLGWKNGCWQGHTEKRRQWLTFWSQFAKHYGEHGQISSFSFVSDSEELPARALMKKLRAWGDWLNTTCGAQTGITTPDAPAAPGEPGGPSTTDWGSIAKWGAIGLGALVALNVVTGLKDAFPGRDR